jgi:hypothetical protein
MCIHNTKKVEYAISGIATLRKHNLSNSQEEERKREYGL